MKTDSQPLFRVHTDSARVKAALRAALASAAILLAVAAVFAAFDVSGRTSSTPNADVASGSEAASEPVAMPLGF